MDSLKNRISKLENTINTLVNNFKKIEDVKRKKDLYSFSTQQLIKWLKENEVDFNESIKDRLIDIVWTNLNEWEWEYYDDEEEDDDEENDDEESDDDKNGSDSDEE
jgi:hypothetical protein